MRIKLQVHFDCMIVELTGLGAQAMRRTPRQQFLLVFCLLFFATAMATVQILSHPAVFTTKTPHVLPAQKYMIPATWRRYQLSQLINKVLSLPQPIPFDFLINGEVVRASIGEWCTEHDIGEVCIFCLSVMDGYADRGQHRKTRSR